ncbi:MAG TPA: ribonuclease P protein component [Acidobacteriaceae bacterium]|nr:ribonuclease P protein component [Acidobacteriaceae bacterium]
MISPSQSPLSKLLSAQPVDGSARAEAATRDTGLRETGLSETKPRETRLRKHADYQRVYKATRKQFSPSMTWFLAPRVESDPEPSSAQESPTSPRVGLTAGKVLGKAHERNRIKRRMREAVRKHILALPDGVDLILHPKRSVMTMDFGKLEAEVLRIFRQAAAQTRGTQERSSGRPGA